VFFHNLEICDYYVGFLIVGFFDGNVFVGFGVYLYIEVKIVFRRICSVEVIVLSSAMGGCVENIFKFWLGLFGCDCSVNSSTGMSRKVNTINNAFLDLYLFLFVLTFVKSLLKMIILIT
jgi:hypothetical protein